jgi:hypothetical protein
MSIQHVVLFRFDPALGETSTEEMYAQVRAWPQEIGGFEQLAMGPPLQTERTHGYQHLLYMVVPDEAALDRYQVHPVHRRFAQWVADHGGTVLALDYALDDDTVVVGGNR